MLANLAEEKMSDNQFNETLKLIEYFQYADLKTESLICPTINLKKIDDKELLKNFWNELESWLKAYLDYSDKHKALYNHVKKIRDNVCKSQANDLSKSTHTSKINPLDLAKKVDGLLNISKLNKIIWF